ncbi:hypothetical protein [Streptomyces sp. NPDC101132]|uniref:hypothetical protein n=1 Tax=Streptomyces sp. NPDC101132 TaxID=3366110 RepID=UPI0037FBD2D2
MGIESDQLVYDYLSRVGDLAQRRQLPSGDRMRLVSTLRNEIDRQRARYEPETPASVRRILDRLGSPEEVLDSVADGGPAVPPAPPEPDPAPAVPAQREPRAPRGTLRFGRAAREAAREADVPPPRSATAPAPPHLAGLDELGDSDGEPDWWRVEPAPFGPGTQVEGFSGGIEIPELLKRPVTDEDAEPAAEPEAGPAVPRKPVGRVRTVVRALRERREAKAAAAGAQPEAAPEPVPAAAAAPARVKPHAFLLLAAAVLVAGAVSGYWMVLAVGWLLAYGSRTMTLTERKWVVLGLPGLVLATAVVWIWGRSTERWGAPLGPDGVTEAFTDLRWWVVRAAAVASAAYLVWRSRRP